MTARLTAVVGVLNDEAMHKFGTKLSIGGILVLGIGLDEYVIGAPEYEIVVVIVSEYRGEENIYGQSLRTLVRPLVLHVACVGGELFGCVGVHCWFACLLRA